MDASPICRGQNLTMETVLTFMHAMPKQAMAKADFNAYAESRMNGWTQTHSQIARQMALYYEDGGVCYPRFVSKVSMKDVVEYVKHWATMYFIPNPYTPSLKGKTPTTIYAYLKKAIHEGKYTFSEACNSIFPETTLNNLDKVRVFLVNFTDILVEGDKMSVNNEVEINENTEIHPSIEALTSKEYFYHFGGVIESAQTDHQNEEESPLQRIFYGAPGTGKSNTIKSEVEDQGRVHFRTTFHPDSDYSTFVGCYKPTMVEAPVRDGSGHEVANAKPEEKNRISYSFVPQAFAKAYCEAWNKYGASENAEPVFLIIEEINRGNCAQIFGDIFQLLDREMEGARCGFSTYPIDADEDLKTFLEVGVKKDGSQWLTNKEGIKDGKLCLPPNLYIWATMNTSDQSLFPIDSAFKRRWDWKYVKIKDGKKNWKIDVKLDDENVDWWAFIQKINTIIASMTSSADKQLGYFFCKADKDGVISTETFVSKVIFYLWNDVFKDYGFEDASLFRYKVKEGEKEVEKDLTFPDFYDEDGETVNAERLADFIRKVMNWQNREGNI